MYAELTLITVEVLFLLTNVAHIALFTMELVAALNALVSGVAFPAEMVVVLDTFEALLQLLAMERFVVVGNIASVALITMSVVFLKAGDAFLTFHAMEVIFLPYFVYAFLAEVAMEFIFFTLAKNIAFSTKVS